MVGIFNPEALLLMDSFPPDFPPGDAFSQCRRRKLSRTRQNGRGEGSPHSKVDLLNYLSLPQYSDIIASSYIPNANPRRRQSRNVIPASVPNASSQTEFQNLPQPEKVSKIKPSFRNYDCKEAATTVSAIECELSGVDINKLLQEIVTNRPPAPKPIQVSIPKSNVCPVGGTPISCPGRGVGCTHSQCFDLREFLMAQTQQTWHCPICGIILDAESLRFDPFFFSPQAQTDENPRENKEFHEESIEFGEFCK